MGDNGFEFADDLLKQMPANLMPGDRQPPILNHPPTVLINHPQLIPPGHFAAPTAQQPFNLKIVKREINNATLTDIADEEYAQQRRRLVSAVRTCVELFELSIKQKILFYRRRRRRRRGRGRGRGGGGGGGGRGRRG